MVKRKTPEDFKPPEGPDPKRLHSESSNVPPEQPEDFKPTEESDPNRVHGESSDVPPEQGNTRYIDHLKYEDVNVPDPVTPTIQLVEFIKGDAELIHQHVKDWRKRYDEDYKVATVELLTLVIEACCAKIPTEEELIEHDKIGEEVPVMRYIIKKELLAYTHVNVVVSALVQIAKIVKVEDYQSSKNFKENLQSFWNHLVLECQDGPLFDGVVLEQCMNYIIHLSSVPEKIYRQTATLMGLQLIETYITVANSDDFKGITGRQYDDEECKQLEWPPVESLKKTYTSTHKISVLELMMCKIFQGLFVGRCRDRDESIRISCIEALGKWMLSYPSMFLKDSSLKYLRWTLIDKSAGVRKASICAMKSIYKVDDDVPTLGELTNRISNRMIELADGLEVSVAVCAIGLVKKLTRDQPHVVLDNLYDFLIDDPARVRPAVGKIVYECLISQEFNSSQSGAKGDCNSSSVHLKRMLRFLKEFSGDRILIIYVINDVWEYMASMEDQKEEKDGGSNFICDWKCIISMLLNEELKDEDGTNLVWLLCASIKKAVGERIVPATDIREPSYTETEKDLFEMKKQDVTRAMINKYPELLTKFMDKKEKVAPLIEVILYLNLQLYSPKRQCQEFENALNIMKDAFFMHKEKEVLASCIKAFAHCISISQQNLSRCALKISLQLKRDLTDNLLYSKDTGERDSLLTNLKRLYELQLSIDVSLNSKTVDVLTSTSESHTNNDDEVVMFQHFNMLMSLRCRVLSKEKSGTIDLLNQGISLSNVLEKLLHIHVGLCNDRKGSWLCIILDKFWALSKMIDPTTPNLEAWRCSPSASTLQKFWNLCLQELSISDVAEDEDVDKEYIETNRDAVMIAALPWVVGDTISAKKNLCPVIAQLVNHGRSVAEIVKHLISFLKSDGDLPNIVLEALKKAYQRHVVNHSRSDDESLASKGFLKLEEMATRLCGTFNVEIPKWEDGASMKSDILKIANDGIDYAFQDAPKQFSFLEGAVLHFVLRLPTDDIQEIKCNVQEGVGKLNKVGDPGGWHSYDTFVDRLAKEEGK